MPAAPPVTTRGWAGKPESVFVGDCCYGKNGCYCVADERGIKPVKAARAQGDQHGEKCGSQNAIENRTSTLTQREEVRSLFGWLRGARFSDRGPV